MRLLLRPSATFLWSITLVYWMGLITFTHIPPTRMAQPRVNDKLLHFVAYALLSFLLSLAARASRSKLLASSWPVIALVLLAAAVDEWTQPLVGRRCSLGDWLADAAGAVLAAIAVAATVSRYGFGTARNSGPSSGRSS